MQAAVRLSHSAVRALLCSLSSPLKPRRCGGTPGGSGTTSSAPVPWLTGPRAQPLPKQVPPLRIPIPGSGLSTRPPSKAAGPAGCSCGASQDLVVGLRGGHRCSASSPYSALQDSGEGSPPSRPHSPSLRALPRTPPRPALTGQPPAAAPSPGARHTAAAAEPGPASARGCRSPMAALRGGARCCGAVPESGRCAGLGGLRGCRSPAGSLRVWMPCGGPVARNEDARSARCVLSFTIIIIIIFL